MSLDEQFFEMLNKSRKRDGQTRLVVAGESCPQIVTENGEDTGYLLAGTTTLEVVNSAGRKVAFITGVSTPRIINLRGNNTGFYLSGTSVKRICYDSAA